MSIHSGLGIALKKSVDVSKFPDVVQKCFGYAGETSEKDEGTLYVWEFVKTSADDMQAMFAALRELPNADYLVVEACHDYPAMESEEDAGDWHDNPWSVHKEISIQVVWEDPHIGD